MNSNAKMVARERMADDRRNRKGGDPSEWPADLRVRQWPKEAAR